ncbi:proline rich transmembrane protein 1B-like [Scyliorhinus canicula]|uniref:proline rich transmembrane protein 1B-like n=1 Tax=Scyliorhinus canicula TaxID=7830 RepID=UPI0018F31224|nr:proline rich transmembrane protein 1B-like [Scyliorhinus canicula]
MCKVKKSEKMEKSEDPPDPPMETYLLWSIFNLLCCCFPIGLVAVFYSCKATKSLGKGNREKAEDAALTAKKLNMAATVTGIFLLVLLLIFDGLGGMKIFAHS